MTYYLDTDTCVFALRDGGRLLKERMASLSPNRIKIPSIVKAELLHGAQKTAHSVKTLSLVEQFLGPYEVMPFDDACAEAYAQIRHGLEKKGMVIGPNDLIIAATVLAHAGTLVTHNTKEFERVPGLKFQDWLEE